MPRVWKIEARFEMTTTAPDFTKEFDSNIAGFALTFADKLKWLTNAPLSRFAFWLPDRMTMAPDQTIFCENKAGQNMLVAGSARYASAKNTTYTCQKQQHKMNLTGGTSFLQAAETLTFEVGVYPASGVDGDDTPSTELVKDIVKSATSGDEPTRKLLSTGLWTYKPGNGVKFHGLFPATRAAKPGRAFQTTRDTSVPLGPNPGGHGAVPPKQAPPTVKDAQKSENEYFATVDETVRAANQVNNQVSNSLKELKDSLSRASAVHAAWMNTDVYKLPKDLTG